MSNGNPALVEKFITRKLRGERRYNDLLRAKDARLNDQVRRHWHDVAAQIQVANIRKERHG